MIPANLIALLTDHCKNSGLGMGHMHDEENNITVIVTSPSRYDPNDVALTAAHMLLTGVLNERLNDANNDVTDTKITH